MWHFRAILGADLHGSDRTDQALEEGVELFEDGYRAAQEHGVNRIYWLGDLTHYKNSLSVKLLTWWSHIAGNYPGISNYLLRGNHDTPWKSEPEVTSLALVKHTVCVTAPIIHKRGGVFVACVPWYPEDQMKHHLREAAAEAMAWGIGPKFLFTHTSLAEGVASLSNERIESPLRLSDLFPNVWTQIFLGDYHASQHVGTNAFYLGAPAPRGHGDFDCRGLWLLEANSREWKLTPIELEGYPEYHSVRLGPGEFLIPQYRKKNHYLVEAPWESHAELRRRYPENVKLKNLAGVTSTAHAQVPDDVRRRDIHAVVRRWMVQRGLDLSLYEPVARKYLPDVSSL